MEIKLLSGVNFSDTNRFDIVPFLKNFSTHILSKAVEEYGSGKEVKIIIINTIFLIIIEKIILSVLVN